MWSKLLAAASVALTVPVFATAEQSPPGPVGLSGPVRIEAGGEPINVEVGHAAPFHADFDGDGRRDLLVGQFGEGKLRIYLNEGIEREPKFGEFQWLQAGAETGTVPAS